MSDAQTNAKAAEKPPRRTESREVRRKQLIDATITSIAKHGIGGTTMSTVTEAAGLSIGIVNFHFQSKQNLFEEVLVHLAREHHEKWLKDYKDAGLTAPEKLLAIVDAHFHPSICSRKKLTVWFAFYGEAKRREAYRKLMDPMDEERFKLSLSLLREMEREGDRPAVSLENVALTLEGLYDGLWLNILMYPEHFTRTGAQGQVRTYLATVFPHHFEIPAS